MERRLHLMRGDARKRIEGYTEVRLPETLKPPTRPNSIMLKRFQKRYKTVQEHVANTGDY